MYWKFDNNYSPKKPFGEVLEGGVPAKHKWPGIHFPGGTSWQKKNFIIIYKNKWSRWKPPGAEGDAGDGQGAGDEKPSDDGSGDDSPSDDGTDGALILVDPSANKYAKIKGKDVCYLTIKQNVAKWKGRCKPTKDDEMKFPPDIIAAVKNKDNDWHFVEKKGTYCKRKDDSRDEVIVGYF
jgi:hypothetical protein